jgi:hypothetical protein
MTESELRLADEKMRAEIMKLGAVTAKINSEASKLLTEAWWYPFVAGAAFFGACVAVVKIFLT